MKKYLIVVAIILILSAISAVSIWLLISTAKELKRERSNFYIEAQQTLDKQQEITKREFKVLFQNEMEQLKEHGVKPGQVQNIVKLQYYFKDTLIKKDTLITVYDTIKKDSIMPFNLNSNCTNIAGYVQNRNIYIDSVKSLDTILLSLYKEKCTFKNLFKKKGIKAIALSSCKQDTLVILRNLKVKKR